MTGTVYKATGSWCTVKIADGRLFECRIKGAFRIQDIQSTHPVVVGDVVSFEIAVSGDECIGRITEVHERRNYIVRKSVKLSKRTHILAANIDQVFLLVTLRQPPTFPAFIDRFLVTAQAYGIPAEILFNKIDIYTDGEWAEVERLLGIYQKIGYECIAVSALTGEGVEKLKERMKGKVSLFSGHSGAGKSTLINALEPGLLLPTAAISRQHGQGQHTTTFAEMLDLSFEAAIIDTPGIKGFGLVDMEKEEIGNYFPEFFALKSQCKFYNCLHADEPQCAVKDALDKGEVAQSRYKSYLQLLQDDGANYRADVYGE